MATEKHSRSIWSGSLSFGLVNIPVTLSSAVSPKEVHFHLLHDADEARIVEKRVCSADGKEVPWSHIVKGYEVTKGKTILVTTEELDRFAPEISKTVDIEQFVDLAEIDPVYYQKTYYIDVNQGGAKAYQLLAASMEASDKVAIGRVVIRQKQHLCAIRARSGQLMMSTMFYPDEIRERASTGAKKSVSAKERGLAEQLIHTLAAPFTPSKLHDNYREKLLRFLKSKATKKGAFPPEPAEETAQTETASSLYDALAASLQRQRTTQPRARRTAKPAMRRRKAAAK